MPAKNPGARCMSTSKFNFNTEKIWTLLEKNILRVTPPSRRGRPMANLKKVFFAISYILKSGTPWKLLPKEYGVSGSTANHYHIFWSKRGVYTELWGDQLQELKEDKILTTRVVIIDCSLSKARYGGSLTGRNPTDRGKLGSKRSLLVSREGIPLSVTAAKANTHDSKLFHQTFEWTQIKLPKKLKILADKAYIGVRPRSKNHRLYTPVRKNMKKSYLSKNYWERWNVERTFAWQNSFSRISTRREKSMASYMGMLVLSCNFICSKIEEYWVTN